VEQAAVEQAAQVAVRVAATRTSAAQVLLVVLNAAVVAAARRLLDKRVAHQATVERVSPLQILTPILQVQTSPPLQE
jgi:hypothetical protein